jgi:hypothetical protein
VWVARVAVQDPGNDHVGHTGASLGYGSGSVRKRNEEKNEKREFN